VNDPTPADQLAIEADDIAQAVKDLERQDARDLKLGQPLVSELRGILESEGGVDDRIRHAAGCALIAWCERLGRIARRDLPAHQA
jgi:hypothetical protein